MTTVVLKAPAGVTGQLQTSAGTYQIDAFGQVAVDASAVGALLGNGFIYASQAVNEPVTPATPNPQLGYGSTPLRYPNTAELGVILPAAVAGAKVVLLPEINAGGNQAAVGTFIGTDQINGDTGSLNVGYAAATGNGAAVPYEFVCPADGFWFTNAAGDRS